MKEFDLVEFANTLLRNAMPIRQKYIIDFANGCAIEETPTRVSRYKIFLDNNGAYIEKRNGREYLNEFNSKMI